MEPTYQKAKKIYTTQNSMILFYVKDGKHSNQIRIEKEEDKLYIRCVPKGKPAIKAYFGKTLIDIFNTDFGEIRNLIGRIQGIDLSFDRHDVCRDILSALIVHVMKHERLTTVFFDIRTYVLENGYATHKFSSGANSEENVKDTNFVKLTELFFRI